MVHMYVMMIIILFTDVYTYMWFLMNMNSLKIVVIMEICQQFYNLVCLIPQISNTLKLASMKQLRDSISKETGFLENLRTKNLA